MSITILPHIEPLVNSGPSSILSRQRCDERQASVMRGWILIPKGRMSVSLAFRSSADSPCSALPWISSHFVAILSRLALGHNDGDTSAPLRRGAPTTGFSATLRRKGGPDAPIQL